MRVYLSDTASLIEILYLKSVMGEMEVNSVASISEADTVIGCNSTDLFYDKTIILNTDTFTRESLEELGRFNKIVSRFPLEADIDVEYELDPYLVESRLLDFEFDGSTRNVMSRLSIKSFIVTKSSSKYRMRKPQMFVNKTVKNQLTVIGLLANQTDL